MLLDFDILRIVSNNIKPAAGKMLISEPLLDDYYFKRSTVLLADEFNNSFMGFILNLKSDKFLNDYVDGFNKENIPLFLGGPVDTDALFYLHTFDFIKNAHKINDELFLNGDIEEIKKLVNSGFANNNNIKFFIGSSGWSPGQLNDEIAFNSWLVSNMPVNFAFSQAEKMWENALNLFGERYQLWKNFPINPDYN
ncbi:MAG: YqgE/AlgH family protein [Bacteroidales bacterium]|jgi:putative transcriptional regulator|nr:YqgE/AlgH family protein [Bacteroidales bacterium]